MVHFQMLLVLGALVLTAMLIDLARAFGWRRPQPYVLPTPLLDAPERSLLAVLEHVLGAEYRILVRVRAAEVLELAARLGKRERERAALRLESYRFDFLICERETLTACCAVNLAPRRFWRRTPGRDGLDRICASVGLPLVRLIEQPHYAIAEVEDRLRGVMPSAGPRRAAIEIPAPEEELSVLRDLARAIDETDEPAEAQSQPESVASAPVRGPSLHKSPEPVFEDPHGFDGEPRFRIDLDLDIDLDPK